ncbi:MAG: DUF1146 family protein [Streptococcus sp.]|nr:DUF1146 family protein [Streptococcus sp.]
MDILNNSVNLVASLAFIGFVHYLLINVIDWSKITFINLKNGNSIAKLKVLILFLSIGIGYLVSRFIIEVISLSLNLFLRA